jgi:transposase
MHLEICQNPNSPTNFSEERIYANEFMDCYYREEGSRQEIAEQFCVSLGIVKKRLQQRKRTGVWARATIRLDVAR